MLYVFSLDYFLSLNFCLSCISLLVALFLFQTRLTIFFSIHSSVSLSFSLTCAVVGAAVKAAAASAARPPCCRGWAGAPRWRVPNREGQDEWQGDGSDDGQWRIPRSLPNASSLLSLAWK